MLQRFLDPAVLGGISGLELVAKTVVEGFIAGLHRSPDFGFSQEFAEYRAYSVGDDLRLVDWNVFARTERCYLKRFRGETNTQMMLLVDASASMGFSSQEINKLDYARYLAASLAYMANHQRDAAGLLVFDDEVRNYVTPSTRQGQLSRLLHGIEKIELGTRTDYGKPFQHCRQFLKRRGVVVVISDFYEAPETVIKTIAPMRWHGSDIVLFHVLDPQEIAPKMRAPALLVDMETRETLDVSPEYAHTEYRTKIDAHITALKKEAQGAGIDYFLMPTDRPLDAGLREYLSIRVGRL